MSWRATTRIFIFLMLACAAACRTAPPPFPKFAGAPPGRVGVLPVSGTLPFKMAETLRLQIRAHLESRGYLLLDPIFVDRAIAREGLPSGTAGWDTFVEKLADLGRRLNVDAWVAPDQFHDSGFQAGVAYKSGLSGTIRWLDVHNKKIAWSAPVSQARYGGVVLESGQILKAVGHTFAAASDLEFTKMAAAIAADVAAAVPEFNNPLPAAPRPVIQQIDAAAGPLFKEGDIVWVKVVGTPGARGECTIPGVPGPVPLHESSSGIYQYKMKILPGHGNGSGRASAVLFDSTGTPGEVGFADAEWKIIAPRLDPPAPPTVWLEPGRDGSPAVVHGRVEPVSGAHHYIIIRFSRNGFVSFKLEHGLEFTDEPPLSAGSCEYSVCASLEGGTTSPPSAPAKIEESKRPS